MSASSTPISRVHPGWPSSSLKNKGLSPAACSTPLLAAFPGNDDEKERRQRRRSRVIDLQTAADLSLNDSASHRYVISLNIWLNCQNSRFFSPFYTLSRFFLPINGTYVLKKTSFLFTALQAPLQLFPSYQMHRSQSITPPASNSLLKT